MVIRLVAITQIIQMIDEDFFFFASSVEYNIWFFIEPRKDERVIDETLIKCNLLSQCVGFT